VTTGHLVPRLCSAGAHSTLHGVVFAFLCLDTCGVPPKGICTASGATHPAPGVCAIEGRFPQNRHPPEAKKPLRKAGLCGFDGSQPLASRGFGR